MATPDNFASIFQQATGRAPGAGDMAAWDSYFAANGTGTDYIGGKKDWVDMIWGSPEAAANAKARGADYSIAPSNQTDAVARNTQLAQEYFSPTPAKYDADRFLTDAANNIARGAASTAQWSAYDPNNPWGANGGSHTVNGIQLVPGAAEYDAAKAAPYLNEIGRSNGYKDFASFLSGYRDPSNFMPTFNSAGIDKFRSMMGDTGSSTATGFKTTGTGSTNTVGTGTGGNGFAQILNKLFNNASSNRPSGNTFNFSFGSGSGNSDTSTFGKTLDDIMKKLDSGSNDWSKAGNMFGTGTGSSLSNWNSSDFLKNLTSTATGNSGTSFTDLWKV